ncbi:hypothetical protein [Sphingopyxis solisilvae]|uniref:hypothetical protein n=1 Tax=Sphingopyxis solisilvae TaxID=1886788 RepID=UPI001E500223|nr:hypothetical protein [Sphingopyxis solisilvae]
MREKQQGLGRPIISAKVGNEQIVAIGNKLLSSRNWKTFPDFLQDYLKTKLDPAWGNAEIAKPLEQRHPIMQWYEALCHFQRKWVMKPGVPTSTDVVGVLACYLGLAYAREYTHRMCRSIRGGVRVGLMVQQRSRPTATTASVTWLRGPQPAPCCPTW